MKVSRTIGTLAVAVSVLVPAAGRSYADCLASEAQPLAKEAGENAAEAASQNWGYGYDSLLADLERWKANPLVKVDSIGASVQGRALWFLTITEGDDSISSPGQPSWRKRRISVHARTHPREVQSLRVAREMIALLLDSSEASRRIRREFIFNIIPMYNPDGVELMMPRQNANGIDIESNWNAAVPQPEVQALRRRFEFLMAGHNPVEVALNLHSDTTFCSRFFVFHEVAGTSAAYAELEKDFIGKVQGYFPSGIEAWHFYKTWTASTPTQYPESYWWANFREKVMALTYEDANCAGAGEFDSTARALVLGSVDYLDARPASARFAAREETRLLRTRGGWRLAGAPLPAGASWELRDARGRRLGGGELPGGEAFIPATALGGAPGVLDISVPGGRAARRLLVPAVPR